MNRAYYSDTIDNFLKTDNTKILGDLAISHTHALEDLQKNAWIRQIVILKSTLFDLSGFVFFEFAIPRMGKRVDNVVIINDLVFVIEFKVGSSTFDNYAIEQVIDYSLDLKNFHEGSHRRKLIPILVATKGAELKTEFRKFDDELFEPLLATETNLRQTIKSALFMSNGSPVNGFDWADSLYKPTPTIIEAAQALYKGHNVKEISRSDSGAKNLSLTANCISEIIDYSKINKRKSICFVTGVPGAGKTLAGLNIASLRTKVDADENAVFLSGNGPLVDVLREALARDKVLEAKESGERLLKKNADSQVKSFIQNIHHFRDDALSTTEPPIEKVAVFDEAQRAWTKEQASKFMQQKKGMADFYIIIGYSFFDTYINNLLLQGVNQDPDKKIIIVDIQKQEAEKFVNKIRSIQDNEFTQDFYNLKTVDTSKLYIISGTSASDFFQEYLGNEAAKLKELIENLTKEEEETPF